MHTDAFPHAQGRWAAGCGESLYLSDARMEEKLYQFAQFTQLCLLAGSLTAYQAFAITNSVSAAEGPAGESATPWWRRRCAPALT
jgi:hypothetical protein